MKSDFFGVFEIQQGQLGFYQCLKHTISSISVSFGEPDPGEIWAENYDDGWTLGQRISKNMREVSSVFACNADLQLSMFTNLKELVLLNCPITEQNFETIAGIASVQQLECMYCEKLRFFKFLDKLRLNCFVLVTNNMQISIPEYKSPIYLVVVRGSLYKNSMRYELSRTLERMLYGIKCINNSIELLHHEKPREIKKLANEMLPNSKEPLKSQLQFLGRDEIVPVSDSVVIQPKQEISVPNVLPTGLATYEPQVEKETIQKPAKLIKPLNKRITLDLNVLMPELTDKNDEKRAESIHKPNEEPGTPKANSAKPKPKKPKKVLLINAEQSQTNYEPKLHRMATSGEQSFVFPTKPIKPSRHDSVVK